jgi:tetratricopeptide (TPR) repeat protein
MEKRIKTKPISVKLVAILVGMWILVFGFGNLANASLVTFQKEYTYQASEADSKSSSRAIALEQVKRLLLEELGTYLESETEVKNFQLTKDQIIVLTAGIVRAEIIDERWDGKTYYLKTKIVADPKEVIKSIDLLRQDRQKTKELEETRKRADEALREVAKLKKELEIAKAEKPDLSQYNKAVNGLSAIDWFEKGVAFNDAGNHKQAIEAYSRAIELDPKYARAFIFRGIAYAFLGNYRQAIKDYDRAIELDPKDAYSWGARGTAYSALGDNRQGIKDFDKAIELQPKFALPFYSRGFAYKALGDNRQAIKDFDRAIELDPNYTEAFFCRGLAYTFLGNYRQAIKDYDRAIELDPTHEKAFFSRGDAYMALGNNRRAIEDIKIAARLGLKEAQDLLKREGIKW